MFQYECQGYWGNRCPRYSTVTPKVAAAAAVIRADSESWVQQGCSAGGRVQPEARAAVALGQDIGTTLPQHGPGRYLGATACQ